MIGYYIIIGFFTLVGFLISSRLKSKFKKYSQVGLANNMSGAEIANAMLQHYNIHDVKITQGQGMLTDHYNPTSKVISLSPDVYSGRSVAAAAVAAHECGHAVQHAEAYSMLQMRSKLVPAVQFSSRIQQFLFMGFIFGSVMGPAFGNYMMIALTITFGVAALFSLVTLPVEFDASRRALAWLDTANITREAEYDGAKDALWWAAMTYVSAALSALVMFAYFALRLLGND